MSKTARGLYAPRLMDATFAIMGAGSAILLTLGIGTTLPSNLSAAVHPAAGMIALACVVLAAVSACLFHKIDRRSWDDYMAQIVSQSALIGMVSLLLSAGVRDVIMIEVLTAPISQPMTMSTIPMACLGWAMGYFFLRWKGTNESVAA